MGNELFSFVVSWWSMVLKRIPYTFFKEKKRPKESHLLQDLRYDKMLKRKNSTLKTPRHFEISRTKENQNFSLYKQLDITRLTLFTIGSMRTYSPL